MSFLTLEGPVRAWNDQDQLICPFLGGSHNQRWPSVGASTSAISGTKPKNWQTLYRNWGIRSRGRPRWQYGCFYTRVVPIGIKKLKISETPISEKQRKTQHRRTENVNVDPEYLDKVENLIASNDIVKNNVSDRSNCNFEGTLKPKQDVIDEEVHEILRGEPLGMSGV